MLLDHYHLQYWTEKGAHSVAMFDIAEERAIWETAKVFERENVFFVALFKYNKASNTWSHVLSQAESE